jgi:hypothetical protein
MSLVKRFDILQEAQLARFQLPITKEALFPGERSSMYQQYAQALAYAYAHPKGLTEGIQDDITAVLTDNIRVPLLYRKR